MGTMATQSPFSFLSNLASSLGKSFTLPDWLVQDLQRRLVLLVNHVLQQEPEAQRRLRTQQDKTIYISWRQFNAQVRITPAGLLDLDDPNGSSDLLLEISEPSVAKLAKNAVNGTKPQIRIAGDVALATELNWVIDNVRWDLEDDLARVIGDVPAHKLTKLGRKAAEALRSFVQSAASTFGGVMGKKDGRASASDVPKPDPAASTSPHTGAPAADEPPAQP